jgi:hypothetical protein
LVFVFYFFFYRVILILCLKSWIQYIYQVWLRFFFSFLFIFLSRVNAQNLKFFKKIASSIVFFFTCFFFLNLYFFLYFHTSIFSLLETGFNNLLWFTLYMVSSVSLHYKLKEVVTLLFIASQNTIHSNNVFCFSKSIFLSLILYFNI